MKHIADATLTKCVECGEHWPCAISRATGAALAMIRGEISRDQAQARLLPPARALAARLRDEVTGRLVRLAPDRDSVAAPASALSIHRIPDAVLAVIAGS